MEKTRESIWTDPYAYIAIFNVMLIDGNQLHGSELQENHADTTKFAEYSNRMLSESLYSPWIIKAHNFHWFRTRRIFNGFLIDAWMDARINNLGMREKLLCISAFGMSLHKIRAIDKWMVNPSFGCIWSHCLYTHTRSSNIFHDSGCRWGPMLARNATMKKSIPPNVRFSSIAQPKSGESIITYRPVARANRKMTQHLSVFGRGHYVNGQRWCSVCGSAPFGWCADSLPFELASLRSVDLLHSHSIGHPYSSNRRASMLTRCEPLD